VLKLAVNLSLAVQVLTFSEGLLLAERGGVAAELAAKVMADSAIGSPRLKARVPLLLDLPDEAWFDVALMHKDIKLALDTARSEGVSTPSAHLADQMLTRATEVGYEHRDIASLLQVLEASTNEQDGRPSTARSRLQLGAPSSSVRVSAQSR
jgi:3-hydroxyisobutyrate dehydrogenase-like beta-hydroxyacid dehydrogenase